MPSDAKNECTGIKYHILSSLMIVYEYPAQTEPPETQYLLRLPPKQTELLESLSNHL